MKTKKLLFVFALCTAPPSVLQNILKSFKKVGLTDAQIDEFKKKRKADRHRRKIKKGEKV